MANRLKRDREQTEAVIARFKMHARHLYESRQLLCAEAVLVTLNQGLEGGLSDEQAIAMAAPFSMALGESGCLCGALSGAVMACGLFMGNDASHHRRKKRACARQLHDEVKAAYGATCCRVLSHRVKGDKSLHFQQCADLTAELTEMATRRILEHRPELMSRASDGPPSVEVSGGRSPLGRVFRLFRRDWMKKMREMPRIDPR